MSITTVPKVGDTVRADYIPSITGRAEFDPTGHAVNVCDVKAEHGYTNRDGNFVTGPVCFAHFTGPDGYKRYFYFSEWTPVIEEIPAAPADEPAPDPQAEQIQRLKSDLADIHNKFSRTIVMISEVMNEEAENRGWCEMFDSIIDSLNNRLPGPYYLEQRETEHMVTVTVNYSGSFTYEVEVTARSMDDAYEMVTDDPSCFFSVEEAILQSVRDHGVDDYDVQPY